MRRSLSDSDEHEIEKSKSIELLCPLIGAVIGVCILWGFLFWGQDIQQARMNAIAFVSPGILVVIVLKIFFSVDIVIGSYRYNIVVATISSIPFAILGAMVFSKRYEMRIAAGELFVIYGVICMSIGLVGISILYPLLETP